MSTYIRVTNTILLAVLLLSSCGREDSLEQVAGNSTTFPTLPTRVDLTVTVKSAEGTAIPDAMVAAGTQLKTTDANGIVRLQDVARTSIGYTLKVSHDAYLSETVLIPYDPAELDLQRTIPLVSKAESNLTINPDGSSTNVGLTPGPTLVVDEDNTDFKLANGETYSGTVVYHGYVTYGGTSAIALALTTRTGQDESFAVFVPEVGFRLEAYSTSGLPLQLAVGSSLLVSVPLSPAEDSEGATADVVRIDPVTGQFAAISEGQSTATRMDLTLTETGTYYLGGMRNSVLIELILHTANDVPVANIPVTLKVGTTLTKTGTDGLGRLSAEVPEGANVQLLVDMCSLNENIPLGSFTADEDLGIVQLTVPGSPVQGSVWDCQSPEELLGYVTAPDEQIALFGPDGIIVGTWLCEQDTTLIDLKITNTISGNSLRHFAWGDLSGEAVDMGQVVIPCDDNFELCGTIRYDEDDDGIAESTSASGARFGDLVQLTGPILAGNIAASPVYFAPIEADGSYCFTELAPGQYELKLNYADPTADYQYSGVWQPVQTASGAASLMISIGGNAVYDVDIQYNEIVPGSISGSIFWDTNNDGIGDLPHDGLKVWLQSDRNRDGIPDGDVSSTVPNAQGEYRFDNVINTAYVLEVRPVGDEVISGRDDSPDDAFEVIDDITNELIPVFLQRGEVDTDNNYILRFESTASTASISGKILIDTDGDGVGDIGYREEFILLNHRDEDGLPTSGTSFEEQVAMTAIDGSFSFDNIPEGEYVLTSTGNIEGPNGFGVFTRVSDKDESPEPGEVLDTAPANGHILVDLPANGQDSDNIFVIRF